MITRTPVLRTGCRASSYGANQRRWFMPAFIDLTGQRYGRLVVIKRIPQQKKGRFWLCACDCGNFKEIEGHRFKSGNTKSCGCYRVEVSRERATKHGERESFEYRSWASAKGRCYNPKNSRWKHYGARGIKMCPEWQNNFKAFLAHIGRCPKGRSLDRINTDGNYEPGNVRWATTKQQSQNRRPWKHTPQGIQSMRDAIKIRMENRKK
jgi:hypothetical protein